MFYILCYLYVCIYVRNMLFIYIYIYIYTHIHTYIYRYVCVCVCVFVYKHRTCELDVLILRTPLYLCVSIGSDLSLKYAGGSMFMHDL